MKPAKPRKRPAAPPRAQPVAVPVAPRRLWRLIAGGFALLLVASAGVWAWAAGLPRHTAMAAATLGSQAGFTVRQVDVIGAKYQPRLSMARAHLRAGRRVRGAGSLGIQRHDRRRRWP